MFRYLPFAALAFAVFLSACGGGGDATPSPTGPPSSPEPEVTAAASPEASPSETSPVPEATPTADVGVEPTVDVVVRPVLTPVTLQSVTSLVAQGEEASVVAQTGPDTFCSIVVIRSNYQGPDYIGTAPTYEVMQLQGLEPTVSDESGRVSWDWRLEADTTVDEWRITVICSREGGTATVSSALEVVEGQ